MSGGANATKNFGQAVRLTVYVIVRRVRIACSKLISQLGRESAISFAEVTLGFVHARSSSMYVRGTAIQPM